MNGAGPGAPEPGDSRGVMTGGTTGSHALGSSIERLTSEEVTRIQGWGGLPQPERNLNLHSLVWRFNKISGLQHEIAQWGPAGHKDTCGQDLPRGWSSLAADIRGRGGDVTYKEIATRLLKAKKASQKRRASLTPLAIQRAASW